MDGPLVELSIISDVFASGVGSVEKLSDGLVRITFYAEARDELGKPIHLVVAKIVRPMHGLTDQLAAMARSTISVMAH